MKRLTALLLTLMMLSGTALCAGFNVYEQGATYEEYLLEHASAPVAGEAIVLLGAEAALRGGAEGEALADGSLAWRNERGAAVWTADVPKDALYTVVIEYTPLPGNGVSVERSILIDGELPYAEARGVVFTRRWTLAPGGARVDNQGNEARPELVEAPERMTATAMSADGLYAAPLQFFLRAGAREIALEGLREPVTIHRLTLAPVARVADYQAPDDPGDVPTVKVQGEAVSAVSDQTLYPMCDFYNSYTEPFEVGVKRNNHIGGYNWRLTGQWVEWTLDVPQDGYYALVLRASQNYMVGLPATRALTIDGETPFAGMESVRFPYGSDWDVRTLKDDAGAPYLFYLTAGEHALRMTVTLGDLAASVRRVRKVASELTTLYGKVIMITGTVPDVYRDYLLEKRIAGLGDALSQAAARLREEALVIYDYAGMRVAEAETLETMANQLESLSRDPDTLPSRLDNFRENLSSLSTWILEISEQPLDIDYIVLQGADAPEPRANPGLLESALTGAETFFLSFVKDYTNIGDVYEKGKALTVWAAVGQEQAATLKALIDDRFTPETGIPVNLNILSTTDTLLYAASGANPPDIVLGISGAVPVDYGVRTALLDLRAFADYNEVAARFHESALAPFGYNGAAYALPITQTFPLLFYRADILEAIGARVPDTWDDVYALVARLQEHNLTMGAGGFFDMFLLQNGGAYFTGDATECLLDSPEGIEAFERYTALYTHYGLPQEYDFYNRFRTGEMPVGIADYTFFNTFSVAAPEIKGLWGIAPVPGTGREGGAPDRSVPATATACAIFSSTKRAEQAWAFLKWFTSTDTQTLYGRQIEAVLGSGARYTSANMEAMRGLSWPSEALDIIFEQWRFAKGIPVIPGSYYVSRHMNNAFREVVTLNKLPREMMIKYVDLINSEINKKREEFHLPLAGEARK